jgi:beta-glucosidase
VAYPFGFGLSYTAFEYGQASAAVTIDGIEVRVPVTNAGDRDGREVVQVYVSLPGSAVQRSPRELKAFANVPIAAGQTVDVMLRIDRADLAYWETRLGRWVVEGGEYHCAVGASSRDLRSTAVVKVPGDDARVPLTPDSTVAEWLADPRGAKLLTEAFAATTAGGDAPPILGMLANPSLMEFIGSFPLGRMAAFGGTLSPDALAKLIAAAND